MSQQPSQLRLLKVIVQPIFVEDDGETLTERPGETVSLAPAEVDHFPAALRAQIEAHNAREGDGGEETPGAP